jgi:hypothetical protein
MNQQKERRCKPQLSYPRSIITFLQRAKQTLRRNPVEIGMLIGSQLSHGDIALFAATVAFNQDADDNQEEGQGTGDGKTDQDDEAKSKVMS